MKAAQIKSYGGQEALQISTEVNRPTLSPGQVLVEVKAAAVNPFDLKVREGFMQDYIPLKLPAILGGDVAGIVDSMANDVSGFEIGQAVYGMANAANGHGSFAEFTPVSANQLANKPSSLDFNQASALPLAGTSAYQAIVEHIDLKAQQKILIHGGAGGIGSFAIQIAKQLGAYVATTADGQDKEFVLSLGADQIIDYKKEDFAVLLSEYDAVFDTVGGQTNQKSYMILKKGGCFVSMVQGPDEKQVSDKQIRYIQQSTKATNDKLTKLAQMVDNGKLKVQLDKIFNLDQAAEAMEHLKSGHPRGKVVIQVN
ncbi:MAG: NADP-dependent oxidoreductase [Candidatus Saccharimonadales bacterium]